MSPDPRDWVRGSLIVASRDLRANAHGLKVWIISGLTLLAILGAAFGISGMSSQGPSRASPTISKPPSEPRIPSSTLRMKAESSATSTRIFSPAVIVSEVLSKSFSH